MNQNRESKFKKQLKNGKQKTEIPIWNPPEMI